MRKQGGAVRYKLSRDVHTLFISRLHAATTSILRPPSLCGGAVSSYYNIQVDVVVVPPCTRRRRHGRFYARENKCFSGGFPGVSKIRLSSRPCVSSTPAAISSIRVYKNVLSRRSYFASPVSANASSWSPRSSETCAR